MTVHAAFNLGSRADRTGEPDLDRGSRAGRVGSALLWFVLPGIAVLLVAAYIAAATIGHVNPPVVPVTGLSMRPTLQAGDLVILKGVDPAKLRKGDIIAINVPPSARKEYDLPAQILHRITKIGHDEGGRVFTTKGDANGGPDVFTTHAKDVVGELRFDVTGLGYPILFFRTRQGEIFLAVAALLAVLYFALGLFEDRRIAVETTAVTMQSVLEETQALKEAVIRAEALRGPPPGVPPVVTPLGDAVVPPDLGHLIDEVAEANERSRESTDVVRTLVGAVADYGEHLRSHTAVMQNLAATTADLHRATFELREAVGGGTEAPAGRLAVAAGSVDPAPLRPPGFDAELAAARERALRTAAELERALARLRGPAFGE